jgi:hypothetical protein
MKRPRALAAQLERLEDRVAPAGNILVSTKAASASTSPAIIREITSAGDVVRTLTLPPAGSGTDALFPTARDSIVAQNGDIHVFNGTFAPVLSTYSAATSSWSSRTVSDWHPYGGNGGIAAFGNYVYVSNAGSPDGGIIRFNSADDSAQRFSAPREFIHLALGLDGRLYALQVFDGSYCPIYVFDPVSMELLGRINIPLSDVFGIAVAANGDIYCASYNPPILRHYDSAANELGAVTLHGPGLGVMGLTDVDISTDGKLILGSVNEYVVEMNDDFTNIEYLKVGSFTGVPFVSFADPIPPPSGPVIHDTDLLFMPLPAGEGQSLTLNGTFTDLNGGAHTVTIDWGDGSDLDTLSLGEDEIHFTTNHTYRNNNPGDAPCSIHATVTSESFLTDDANALLVVHNLPPAPTITGIPTGSPAGTQVSLGVDENDPGIDDTFTYAWSVTRNGEPVASGTDSTLSLRRTITAATW